MRFSEFISRQVRQTSPSHSWNELDSWDGTLKLRKLLTKKNTIRKTSRHLSSTIYKFSKTLPVGPRPFCQIDTIITTKCDSVRDGVSEESRGEQPGGSDMYNLSIAHKTSDRLGTLL